MPLDETYLQEAEDRLAAVSPPLRAVFRDWAPGGRALAELAAAIAGAYFKASPDVLPALAGAQMGEWAHLGERLYKATWKSISLASTFFALSPVLLRRLTLSELGRLARVLEGISDRSADLAAARLAAAPGPLHSLSQNEPAPFIDFAAAISDGAWPEAALYFQRGPDLLRGIEPGQRARYLELSSGVARRLGRQAYVLFAEGSLALRDVAEVHHGRLIELAEGLAGPSPAAAIAPRPRPDELAAWPAAGVDVLGQTLEGGEAYFRLESGKAEETIQALSAPVDPGPAGEPLRLYGKALTGANISVQPVAALEEKGIGWVSERGPSPEGSAVYLPQHIEQDDT